MSPREPPRRGGAVLTTMTSALRPRRRGTARDSTWYSCKRVRFSVGANQGGSSRRVFAPGFLVAHQGRTHRPARERSSRSLALVRPYISVRFSVVQRSFTENLDGAAKAPTDVFSRTATAAGAPLRPAMNRANAERRAMHHVTPTSTDCGARRGLDRPQGETPQGRCGADALRRRRRAAFGVTARRALSSTSLSAVVVLGGAP